MNKYLLLLILALFTIETMAQYDASYRDYVIRNGEKYQFADTVLKGKAYADFLYTNCPPAYCQYKSGNTIANVGWGFFGAGLAFHTTSLICLITGDLNIISAFNFAGSVFEATSIPLLIVGYVRMHQSADTYNIACRHNLQSYWTLNASQDGLGLAWHF